MRTVLFQFLGAAVLATAVIGCGKSEPEPAKVKGKVTLNKAPLPDGKITFSVAGKPPMVMDIKNGAYEGKARPGMNKVEMGVYKPGKAAVGMPDAKPADVNTLPNKYHGNSTLTAEIKEGADNVFDYDLTVP